MFPGEREALIAAQLRRNHQFEMSERTIFDVNRLGAWTVKQDGHATYPTDGASHRPACDAALILDGRPDSRRPSASDLCGRAVR